MKIIGEGMRMTPRLRATMAKRLKWRPGRSREFRFDTDAEAKVFCRAIQFVGDPTCYVTSRVTNWSRGDYMVMVRDEKDA